jgi:excisionase family DNA binding protein
MPTVILLSRPGYLVLRELGYRGWNNNVNVLTLLARIFIITLKRAWRERESLATATRASGGCRMKQHHVITIAPAAGEVNKLTFTVTELAKALNISVAYVWLLVRKREIPFVRLGRRVLFRVQDVERFLEQRLQKAASKGK